MRLLICIKSEQGFKFYNIQRSQISFLQHKQMQQQIHSYAFQLSQNLSESVLACHQKDSTIYMGAKNNKQQSKSFLYQLKYQQQSPRKSQIKSKIVNGHIKQINSLSSQQQNLLIVARNTDKKYQVSTENFGQEQRQQAKNKVILSSNTQISLSFNKQTKKCLLVEPTKITNFDLQKLEKQQEYVNLHNQNQVITSCTVDPIHEFLTYVKNNRQIVITDKSFKKQKYGLKIGEKDPSLILSLDYNPNKQYYLMTSHYQCLKFWDIRKPSLPVKVHSDHHSILLSSKYNHSHDQLICCSYDDGTVGLMRMSSVSSSPTGQNQDVMVKLYDQHQDSVYNIQWCSFSPWFFASLSYSSANLVVNVVPNVQKYRILL